MPKSRISNVANISFNAIRKNKILPKNSELTVYDQRANEHDQLLNMVHIQCNLLSHLCRMEFPTVINRTSLYPF